MWRLSQGRQPIQVKKCFTTGRQNRMLATAPFVPAGSPVVRTLPSFSNSVLCNWQPGQDSFDCTPPAHERPRSAYTPCCKARASGEHNEWIGFWPRRCQCAQGSPAAHIPSHKSVDNRQQVQITGFCAHGARGANPATDVRDMGAPSYGAPYSGAVQMPGTHRRGCVRE